MNQFQHGSDCEGVCILLFVFNLLLSVLLALIFKHDLCLKIRKHKQDIMKNILITGASSGIGEATAIKLAASGHNVLLMARRVDRLQKLKSTIEASGGKAHIYEGDVTDFEQVQAHVLNAQKEFGSVDVVVNNAGLMPMSFMRNGKIEEAHRMVDVNINGVINLIYAALPGMIEKNNGHFINISSVAGDKVLPASAVYSGTKFAVKAISEGLRMEMAADKRNIRVTVVKPGAVATELSSTITDPDVAEVFKQWGDVEFLEAKDIAHAIAYAIDQPDSVSVNEITVRPSTQPL